MTDRTRQRKIWTPIAKEVIQLMHSADFDVTNDFNKMTPLYHCARYGNDDLMMALLKAGAKPNVAIRLPPAILL